MKTFLNSSVVILFLLICGCSTTPDNTAVSSDGVKIVFNKQGSGEPAVIFIHGWSNDKSIWDAQMNYFSKKYESVSIDLAGFGESGSNRKDLPDGKAGWTINAFADDVSAVIDKLDLRKVVLVGFSMGGPVAVETANLIPGKVAGIVLVDNLQDVDQKVPEQAISKVVAGMMDLVNNPSVRKLVSGGFVKKDSLKAFNKILSMLDNPKTGWEESLTATIKWQNDECTQSLSELKVPVAAINSERMPTNVEAFRKYVPVFKADIVPGVGHVIMWDAPKKFNELLEKDIKLFM